MSESLTPQGAFNTANTGISYTNPSHTYKLEYESDKQWHGYCDDLRAVEQAVYKILNTERYKYLIYSWNYGIELEDLFGQPIPYVYAEVQRRIQEALLWDDRVKEVNNFRFSDGIRGEVTVLFDVITEYGVLEDVRKVVETSV